MKRKVVEMKLAITVPGWMTTQQARREVRSMIRYGVGWLSHGPDFEDVEVKLHSVETLKGSNR